MLKSAHSSKKKNIKTETEVLKSSSGDVISII